MARLVPTGLTEPAPAVVSSALAAPPMIEVTVPRTTVRALMRVITRSERFQATADARAHLQASGFPIDATAGVSLGASEQWLYELALRTLAAALRDPEDSSEPLASIEEWRECDDDQIDAMWEQYESHRAKVDPLGANVSLTTDDVAQITAAAKKGDASLLMAFGLRRLALYVTTTACPPASSTTPES